MYCKLICVFVLLAETFHGWSMVYDIPRELHECVDALRSKTESNTGNPSLEEDIHVQCLQEFLWKTDIVNWSSFNITSQEMAYVNSLIPSLVRPRRGKKRKQRKQRKQKKQEKKQKKLEKEKKNPKTGFRIRREYRMLNDSERKAFHDAINIMKDNGTYNTFANMHRGEVVRSAHNGPNFFSWHRVYLSLFEEALRQINPDVSLPYFDSTMDYDMDNPVNSFIWTDSFLGNGDGFVVKGPFANWTTSVGRLTRNIGGRSTLFTKETIAEILTRCHTSQICKPTAERKYDLEHAHGGPHLWIGGQMAGLYTSSHDPVFFLHHAFVDYIWDQFQRKQKEEPCKVNPWKDYPDTRNEFHLPSRRMDNFTQYKNKDGYNKYWTKTWYNYEDSPTCNQTVTDCGTPYLRCNVTSERCISKKIEKKEEWAPMMVERVGFDAKAETIIDIANKAKEEEDSIDVGRLFDAPPSEERTQDAMMPVE